ncbi:MAG TPA: hypothetical protein P5181_11260 [Dermatophilaceae bacterium]|nr:hypothetical protein [Dermatophilaceae bacterium]
MDELHERTAGLPRLRGDEPGALRHYVVSCRTSAVIAARQGRADLQARLEEAASRVERRLDDPRRADLAALA